MVLEKGLATHSSIFASSLKKKKGLRRRKWQPTPVLLPGKSHGWRSLGGCSPWGRKEPDTTERLHFTSTYFQGRNRNADVETDLLTFWGEVVEKRVRLIEKH